MESKLVRLELTNKSILIINSNVKHELTGSEYPTRRKNCTDAASKLSLKSLRYANLSQLEEKISVSCDYICHSVAPSCFIVTYFYFPLTRANNDHTRLSVVSS